MAQIDNIDPIKSFFSSEKLQLKIFNFLKKNNYKIINKKEYLDKSFDIKITKGKPLPQIKNVGFLGKVDIKEIKSIQEKRTFKKLHKQINRVIDNKVAPITIDRKGYIINGHHRYDALRILGKKKVIVRLLNLNAKDMINLDLSAKELQKLLKHHKFNTLNILSFKQIPELEGLTDSAVRMIIETSPYGLNEDMMRIMEWFPDIEPPSMIGSKLVNKPVSILQFK